MNGINKVKTEVVLVTLNELWLLVTQNTTKDKEYILEGDTIVNDILSIQICGKPNYYKTKTTIKQWDEVVDENGHKWIFICDLWAPDEDGDRFIIKSDRFYNFTSSIKKVKKAEEMTLEEVCEELGREVKIVKERQY